MRQRYMLYAIMRRCFANDHAAVTVALLLLFAMLPRCLQAKREQALRRRYAYARYATC